MIRSVLIANRGEIACRIARTAAAMGIRTVAVYSDADAGAPHVRACDAAVRIGPPPVADSYLNIAAIIEAAKASGADAVHPGYGFLSENAAFAGACVAAGLTFVGPPAAAIAAMGNKAAAKARMEAAGVPVVPGWRGADQSDATLLAEARRIGLPVMVKAAAGGGGRGMRLITSDAALEAAITGARNEAASAFGSGELLLEKAVTDARHVEVQVFADTKGTVIHLGERDCSVQRRHQKVIEEAPSPAVSPDLRARMGAAAVAAAKAVNYVGAGTVEFLLGGDGAFYFLEMNTRLQVEHPVTEAVTGLDLVEWQFRIANGETMPLRQEQVALRGHAIEVRLYAEDPARNFLPQSGTVVAWQPPPSVRTDAGIASGQTIGPWYDPMLAKIIAHGATREEARTKLIAALERTVLLGLPTNRRFLIDLLSHADFAGGRATTGFIGQHFARIAPRVPTEGGFTKAAALLFTDRDWGELNGFSSTGAMSWPMKVRCGEETVSLLHPLTPTLSPPRGGEGDKALSPMQWGRGLGEEAAWVRTGARLHLDDFLFEDITHEPPEPADAAGADRVLAPMNGKVVTVLAKAGDSVTKGQRLVVLEAMKMQHELLAPRDGALAEIVSDGAQVANRQVLARLQ